MKLPNPSFSHPLLENSKLSSLPESKLSLKAMLAMLKSL